LLASSHLLVLIGFVAVAIGGYGIFYFGKQVNDQKDANLGQLLSKLTTTEQTLRLAAIHKIGLAGGIIESRTSGDGVQARFVSLSQPFSTVCEYLADIPDLREISFGALGFTGSRPKINSLEPISRLVGLEVVDLRDTGVEDITPLASLVDLRFLFISGNLINDITPLSSLSKLELLDISENSVTDLAPIQSSQYLRVLWAYGTNITNLQPLVTLPRLKSVDLEGFASEKVIPIDPSEVERFRLARPDVEVAYTPEG